MREYQFFLLLFTMNHPRLCRTLLAGRHYVPTWFSGRTPDISGVDFFHTGAPGDNKFFRRENRLSQPSHQYVFRRINASIEVIATIRTSEPNPVSLLFRCIELSHPAPAARQGNYILGDPSYVSVCWLCCQTGRHSHTRCGKPAPEDVDRRIGVGIHPQSAVSTLVHLILSALRSNHSTT